jgi:hypothetical protein
MIRYFVKRKLNAPRSKAPVSFSEGKSFLMQDNPSF